MMKQTKRKQQKRITYIATLALLTSLLGTAPVVQAEDLGLMRIDSTTIDDRFSSMRSEASNVSIIDGDKVEQVHSENIKQVLDSIPGITTELQSQDSLKIHIRGVDNQRFMGEKPGVAVVIDGVPVFERTGRVNINMDDIASIKVIKGGASFLFGEDALSGAVIITTKRGASMAGGYVSAEAGSFGYQRGVARAGFATEKMSGHVQVSRRKSDSYYYQGDYKADYLNGKLQGYLSDSSDLTLGWEVANRLKDSHGTVQGVTQATIDPTSIQGRDYTRHYDVGLGKYYLTYANDWSDTSNLLLNIYQFSDHTRYWSSPVRYDVHGAPVSDVNAYQNHNDYNQVQRGIKGEWRTAGNSAAWLAAIDLRANTYDGLVQNLQDFKASPSPRTPVSQTGQITSNNHTGERVAAIYGETKISIAEPATLTINGRLDHIQYDYIDHLPAVAAAADLSKTFQVPSWRLGGNYEISDTTAAYSNISTGFRAPTIRQLFAGTISPTGSVDANPNLDPEHAINYEIGMRGKLPAMDNLSWDIAAFQIERKHSILNVAGQYAKPTTGTQDQYQNIGGMRNRGIDLALNSNPNQMLSFDLAYALLDARFTQYDNFNLLLGNRFSRAPGGYSITSYNNSGNVLPRTPKHKLFIAVNLRPTAPWLLTTEINAQSSYFADEINQEKIGGHTIFNLISNYTIRTHADDGNLDNGSTISLFARIDNLLDRTYYNPARGFTDSNADFVYNAEDLSITVNPGRQWSAGITASF